MGGTDFSTANHALLPLPVLLHSPWHSALVDIWWLVLVTGPQRLSKTLEWCDNSIKALPHRCQLCPAECFKELSAFVIHFAITAVLWECEHSFYRCKANCPMSHSLWMKSCDWNPNLNSHWAARLWQVERFAHLSEREGNEEGLVPQFRERDLPTAYIG